MVKTQSDTITKYRIGPSQPIQHEQWRIVGTEQWHNSGHILEVDVGTYEVEFSDTENCHKPDNMILEVQPNDTVIRYAQYQCSQVTYNIPTEKFYLWLDSSDISSLQIIDNKISSWNDISGNNINFIQSTVSSRPLYTTDGIQFIAQSTTNPNANHHMSSSFFTLPFPFTIFVASKDCSKPTLSGTTYNQGTFISFSGGSTQYNRVTTSHVNKRNGTYTQVWWGNEIWGIKNKYVSTGEFLSLSSIKGYINGELKGHTTTSTSNFTPSIIRLGKERLGSSMYPCNPLTGTIQEIIVGKNITEMERIEIEQYLMNKWSII